MQLWKSRLVAVLFSTAVSLLCMPLMASAAEAEQVVSVQGAAMRQIEPDLAYVTVGVQTEGATTEEASSENNAVMQRLNVVLKDAGIATNKVQTGRLQLTPVYGDVKSGKRSITGYSMSNTVIVEMTAMDKIGTLVETMLNAGANQLQGVRFTVKDKTTLEEELLKEAVKDGRRKAEVLANAGGRSLGAMVKASVGGGPEFSTMDAAQYRLMGKAADTPVYAGMLTINVEVQLAFALQ